MSDALDFRAKASRMRAGRAFRSLGGGTRPRLSKKTFNHSKGVIVNGRKRMHRGKGRTADAAGKLKAHIRYNAGDRHKEADRERRQLFDDRGREQRSDVAIERHGDPYMEQRFVISPSAKGGRVTESDLHILAQATIQEVRARNPKAEIEASYAIHQDSENWHAHVLLTSEQRIWLTKNDYREIKEMNQDLRLELEQMREKGLEFSHQNNFENEQTLDRDLGQDLGQELSL